MDEAITCSACRKLLRGNGSFVDLFSKEIKHEDKVNLKNGLDVSLRCDAFVNCRACALQKTEKKILERRSNKLLPGLNWDVDEDEDYIHTHGVHLDKADLSWTKIYANQSDFEKHLEIGSIEKVQGKHSSLSCLIPPSFGVFSSDLTELKIIGNDISALPEGFGNGLQKLRKIDLSHNGLTKIPSSFCSMKNLRGCMLSYNKLKRLPENFSDLVNLEHLKLDNNEVNQLPLSFSQCHNLSTLDLCGNPFSTFPSILIKMPQLQCLGIDIDLSHMSIVMKYHFLPQDILYLHSARIHGNDYYNRKSTNMDQLDLNSNQAFIAKIMDNSLILKRKSLESGYFKNRSVKHSRTHFDFFEQETMIFDDELDWAKSNNPCWPVGRNCISVNDAEQIRLMIQKELTFGIREHMPRMPNKSVALPLFSKNPLFPPRKRKRVILRQKR